MAQIFDWEAKFENTVRRLSFRAPGNGDITFLEDRLSDMMQEMVMDRLAAGGVSEGEWDAYLRERLPPIANSQ